MCYVYVLRSNKNSKRYCGSTKKTPESRLEEHNSGRSNFTKNNGPFVLLYSEKFSSITDARKRESFLKTGQGRRFLDRVIPP